MAITINKAFIQQYKDNVIHLVQQAVTKLKDKVTVVSSGAASYNFDRLAAVAAPTDKSTLGTSGRRVATTAVFSDDTWTRRVAQPKTWAHAMSIENEDKVQMLAIPENEYAKAQAMTMNRKWDDIIIAAATGTSLDGDGNSVAYDTANQKIGDGTTSISFDMVTAVQEKFMAADIPLEVPKVFVVGPTQVRKLLQLTEQTSADFVQREALQRLYNTGIVPNWMGFEWIMSTRLLVPAGGQLSCLAFTKEAIGLAINEDMFIRVGENPALSYAIQLYYQFTAGATRINDQHLIHVHVLNSL